MKSERDNDGTKTVCSVDTRKASNVTGKVTIRPTESLARTDSDDTDEVLALAMQYLQALSPEDQQRFRELTNLFPEEKQPAPDDQHPFREYTESVPETVVAQQLSVRNVVVSGLTDPSSTNSAERRPTGNSDEIQPTVVVSGAPSAPVSRNSESVQAPTVPQAQNEAHSTPTVPPIDQGLLDAEVNEVLNSTPRA